MSGALKLEFAPLTVPPKGVLILFCEEGLKFGSAARRIVEPTGDLPQLIHRHLGDVQSAGGVEDDGVDERLLRLGDGVLADLDRDGILKNTLVIVTSDHGESLGDHGLSYHGAALYRELVRVPLIFSWPGHLPEGVRVVGPVGNKEIAATIMSIVAGRCDPFPQVALDSMWGRSTKQASTNSAAAAGSGSDRSFVVSELPETNTIVKEDRVMQGKEPLATDGWMRSLVSSRWQLITHEKYGDQIYDWKTDPSEARDLINTPEGGQVRSWLRGAEGEVWQSETTPKTGKDSR